MPHPTEKVAVRHPDVPGVMVVLDPALDYAEDDLLVRAYPWAFEPKANVGQIVESVSVEQATAAPGERRNRSRA